MLKVGVDHASVTILVVEPLLMLVELLNTTAPIWVPPGAQVRYTLSVMDMITQPRVVPRRRTYHHYSLFVTLLYYI